MQKGLNGRYATDIWVRTSRTVYPGPSMSSSPPGAQLWLLRSVSAAVGPAFAPSSGPVWGTSFLFLKGQVLFASEHPPQLTSICKGSGLGSQSLFTRLPTSFPSTQANTVAFILKCWAWLCSHLISVFKRQKQSLSFKFKASRDHRVLGQPWLHSESHMSTQLEIP